MARHIRRELNYDVPFGGVAFKPVTLGATTINALARILGHQPSSKFLNEFAEAVGIYAAYRRVVAVSGPTTIFRRLNKARGHAEALKESLAALELTDSMWFGRFATRRLLRGHEYAELDHVAGVLSAFLPVITSAAEAMSDEAKQGRMPAFAEEALARALRDILKRQPRADVTSKPGGSFDRVLRLALEELPDSKPRKNVVDLMRKALGEDKGPTSKRAPASTAKGGKPVAGIPGKKPR